MNEVKTITVKTRKRGKKSKSPDKRPARANYWNKCSLRANKIRNLMRCNGMSRDQAERFWMSVKTSNRTTGTMRTVLERRKAD